MKSKNIIVPRKTSHFISIAKQGGAASLMLILAACGGGVSDKNTPVEGTTTVNITSFELIDPTPGENDNYGSEVIILGNGNIIVSDPHDSSVATDNGAIHLFDTNTHTLLGSVYGDDMGDLLGISGSLTPIIVLPNNNYVVHSRFDDINGTADTGSIRLIDGETGLQIGNVLAGDNLDDDFGRGNVTALGNSNYVFSSSRSDENGINDAGSVRLMSGTTGEQIGETLVGDNTNDRLGYGGSGVGIIALPNNNYVVASQDDNVNDNNRAGSVRLMNGTTGTQIGDVLEGDSVIDQLGNGPIIALKNNNYVVSSTSETVDGLITKGSIRLMSGANATQIGSLLAGAGSVLTPLQNNNYVVASPTATVGADVSAGWVRLMNGTTGANIGSAQEGGSTDKLGSGGVIGLTNNNYLVISPERDIGVSGQASYKGNAGSVQLMNGVTGNQIGVLFGENEGDRLGYAVGFSQGVTVLSNMNYVIASPILDANGTAMAGTVRLMSGTSGTQIGTSLHGDSQSDQLGSYQPVALSNGNYVLTMVGPLINGIPDTGSVRLVSGSTGVQIGTRLEGEVGNDFTSTSITPLADNNYVVIAPKHHNGGSDSIGSMQLLNGATGAPIGDTTFGLTPGVDTDLYSAYVIGSDDGDYFILAAPAWNNNNIERAGLVRLIAR